MKAHVIPEAFFRELREGDQAPLLVSASPSAFPKLAPIGVYDREILCAACESNFSGVDDYGIQILLKRLDELFWPIKANGEAVAFQAQGIDQNQLLRFLISVLWRASVSTQGFYHRVELGPYEELARQVILQPDSSVPQQFGAVLSRWTVQADESAISRGGLMDPFRERWDGVNAYRFYFGLVVAYIRVDTRQFGSPLSEVALLSEQTTTILSRSLSRSKDLAAMTHTAKESHKHQQRRHDARNAKRKHLPGTNAA